MVTEPDSNSKFGIWLGARLSFIIGVLLAGCTATSVSQSPLLPTPTLAPETVTSAPSPGLAHSTPSPTPSPISYLPLQPAPSPTSTPTPPLVIRSDTLILPSPTLVLSTPTPDGRIVCTINTVALHLREGPNVNYRIIDTLAQGSAVSAVKCAPGGDWLLVETTQQELGWINTNFVACQGNIKDLPLAEGVPAQIPTWPLTPTPAPSSTATAAPAAPIDSWQGEYFNNPHLAGEPVLIRLDPELEFNWILDSPAPNIPADNFSIRWTRQIDFLDGGDFRFFAEADDGLKIYVDGRLILDDWHTVAPVTYRADVRGLSPGLHTVTVEYFESGGYAYIKVWGDKTRLEDTAWRAEYYPNRELKEPALFVRPDEVLDFDWGKGSPAPGLDGDQFSVRWRRTVFFDEGGDYKFFAKVAGEDQVKIFLDDWVVVDKYKEESGTVEGFFAQLSPGFHIVTVEYQEEEDRARIKVWWDRQ